MALSHLFSGTAGFRPSPVDLGIGPGLRPTPPPTSPAHPPFSKVELDEKLDKFNHFGSSHSQKTTWRESVHGGRSMEADAIGGRSSREWSAGTGREAESLTVGGSSSSGGSGCAGMAADLRTIDGSSSNKRSVGAGMEAKSIVGRSSSTWSARAGTEADSHTIVDGS